jgi:quinol monooxygenase YgiN
MDAPYLYIVKFWVHPDSRKAVMDWLDNGHMAEVVAQPGFRFVRRVSLEQASDDGWSAHMMIYGLESKAALQRYVDGPAPAKFAQERKPFEHHLRMERASGAVDARIP